jgi:hypothetical protein
LAGTLGFYKYQSDNGTTYSIRMDDSNADAVNNEPVSSANLPSLPFGMRPRKAHFQHYNEATKRLMKRSVVIGSRSNPLIKNGGTATLTVWQETAGATTAWRCTGYTGERRTFY